MGGEFCCFGGKWVASFAVLGGKWVASFAVLGGKWVASLAVLKVKPDFFQFRPGPTDGDLLFGPRGVWERGGGVG